MAFTTRNGTRGAAQPGGRLLKWMNTRAMGRLRHGKKDFLGGRKNGVERQSPVNFFPGEDGSRLIVASAAGAAANPA